MKLRFSVSLKFTYFVIIIIYCEKCCVIDMYVHVGSAPPIILYAVLTANTNKLSLTTHKFTWPAEHKVNCLY